MKNPNCDNDKCLHSKGVVKLLPTGGGSNAILCRECFEHERLYRKERNRTLENANQFALPYWGDLKIYIGE